MVQVKIKWNKVTFDDVEINISEGVTGLKNKILELTGVPLDRQKLMAKGGWIGTLKDDADLSKLKITPGLQILLMGSADVVVAPKEAITFFEDLTSEQKAEKGVAVSAGLNNLGNTCYMNSTVQCFRHMSELRETLAPLRASQDVNVDFSVALRDTLTQMDGTSGSFTPFAFVGKLRNNFPQFAQADPRGNFMQQDAEEFFNLLVNCLDRGVSSVQPGRFDQLLTVQLEEELTCKETEAEPKVIKTDRVNKIVCNIDATVDHLQDGIKIAFEGTMEKHSSVLGRDAVWGKKQRIASLPLYLCVHFMRFFWKATPESRDHAGVKCKVLRPVSYPEVLDVFGLCSDGLQQSLRRNREVERKKFEDEFKLKQGATAGAAAAGASADAAVSAAVPEAVAMDVEADEEAALAAALSLSLASDGAAASAPASASAAVSASEVGELVSQGLPVGFTGNYELFGLVTHKGRSADSGHYIGWVRQAPGSQFWWKYDDEKVSEVATDEIMKLSGGGDRDMAYFVFYRAK